MLQYFPIARVTVPVSLPPGPAAPALRKSPRRTPPGWRIDLPPRTMFCVPVMAHDRETRLPVSVLIHGDLLLVLVGRAVADDDDDMVAGFVSGFLLALLAPLEQRRV